MQQLSIGSMPAWTKPSGFNPLSSWPDHPVQNFHFAHSAGECNQNANLAISLSEKI